MRNISQSAFYKVVFDDDIIEVEITVNHLVASGWKPAGGLMVTVEDESGERVVTYFQALWREVPGF